MIIERDHLGRRIPPCTEDRKKELNAMRETGLIQLHEYDLLTGSKSCCRKCGTYGICDCFYQEQADPEWNRFGYPGNYTGDK